MCSPPSTPTISAPTSKWEAARGGDLFPHVYGDVRAWQVQSIWPLEMGEDGAPLAPDGRRAHRLKTDVTS